MNAYLDAMKQYATFSGRATRSQYWLFVLFFFILVVVGSFIDVSIGSAQESGLGVFAGLVVLVHLLPSIAVFARRMHDTDRSGWWYLLNAIPLGQIVAIIFLCMPSTAGANRFGLPVGSAAGTSPAPASAATGSLEHLEKLASLRASGAIDEAEFQKMKATALKAGGH